MSFFSRLFGKCCCNCNCNCCNCNCHCRSCKHKIQKGDMVRYTDEAKKSIATVIPEGNPFRRVTEVEEQKNGRLLVRRCDGSSSDSSWLEKCCC